MNAARPLLLTLALCSVSAAQPEGAAPSMADEIKAVTAAQAKSWNEGDLDAFIDHYWKSDDLTLCFGGETRRGFEAVQRRFHNTYPDPERMGRASFSDLEVFPLGDSAAYMLGRWRVDRGGGPIGGNFTLVFRKIDGRWVIVHDHTSVGEPADPPAAAPDEKRPDSAKLPPSTGGGAPRAVGAAAQSPQ